MNSAADLVMASTSEVDSIVASDYPLGMFSGVSLDGMDPLKLAALESLLCERPFDDVLGEYRPVAQASPKGPWLVRLPEDLIAYLVKIPPPDQAIVAARWAATTQVTEAGWSEQDADNYLGRLIPFAHKALYESKALFLWVYG
jgi:hypothetical protein